MAQTSIKSFFTAKPKKSTSGDDEIAPLKLSNTTEKQTADSPVKAKSRSVKRILESDSEEENDVTKSQESPVQSKENTEDVKVIVAETSSAPSTKPTLQSALIPAKRKTANQHILIPTSAPRKKSKANDTPVSDPVSDPVSESTTEIDNGLENSGSEAGMSNSMENTDSTAIQSSDKCSQSQKVNKQTSLNSYGALYSSRKKHKNILRSFWNGFKHKRYALK